MADKKKHKEHKQQQKTTVASDQERGGIARCGFV